MLGSRLRIAGIATALAVAFFASASRAQTTYWVDDQGNDGNFGTSSGTAWKHISYAVTQVSAGDTIKVMPGTYSVAANGESFPINVPVGVLIQSSSTNPVDWPRVGGDVTASTSANRAVFEVVADGVNRGEVKFHRIVFVGEDHANKDGPHAVYAEVLDDGAATVVLDTCTLERSEMNGGTYDRPSVLGVCGDGNVTVKAVGCSIVPNPAGGIQMALGDDCIDEDTFADLTLDVSSCSFELTGSDGAGFAIDNFLIADQEQRYAVSSVVIHDNQIDSREASGESSGFAYGIRVGVEAAGLSEEQNASLSIQHDAGETLISQNTIMGCRSEAVRIVADARQYGTANVQVWHIDRNKIVENQGDGLVIDGGDSNAYLRCQTQSDLIADNRNGLIVADGENLAGALAFIWDTIANNSQYGVQVEVAEDYITNWANSINYGNASGSYLSGGWTPADVVSGGWQTNDWYGYGTYFDPGFVDDDNGDYHISSSSGCRNAGTNSPQSGYTVSLMGPDVYVGRRIDESTTDIGADEYNP